MATKRISLQSQETLVVVNGSLADLNSLPYAERLTQDIGDKLPTFTPGSYPQDSGPQDQRLGVKWLLRL